jgi:cathepsin E
MTLCVEAYKSYCHVTGAVLDSDTGLLSITLAQFSNLKSLFFTIGGRAFEFTPSAQIWPRAFNKLIRGKQDRVYLVVNELPSPFAVGGFQFVSGYMFLERFYSVYDASNRRVGLAETPFTKSDIN